MSFLGSIVSKILHPFGGSTEAQAHPSETQAQPSSGGPAATPTAGDALAPTGGSASAAAPGSIDIYTGDRNVSAAANVWLHKQVIKKLEENGGKVPDDLKE